MGVKVKTKKVSSRVARVLWDLLKGLKGTFIPLKKGIFQRYSKVFQRYFKGIVRLIFFCFKIYSIVYWINNEDLVKGISLYNIYY